MADRWAHLGINPFVHLGLAATPIFRLWIGVAEFLFRSEPRLDAALHAALYDPTHLSDDLEFVVGARRWSQCDTAQAKGAYRLPPTVVFTM